MLRIAVVQKAPVFLEREKTVALAAEAVGEAAAQGARLIVFPEAFVPGYPAWIWRLRPGGDMALAERLHAALLENAVSLDADQLAPLREAARKHQATVVCGLHERDAKFSRGTLYNTVVVIGPDGEVLNRHRKLMPTNPERMVWGWGDASGLRAVDTPSGRVGALICWENYMPLARYALPERDRLYPALGDWVNGGDSAVVAPGGKLLAGPMRNQQGILYAELDMGLISAARRSLDVVGHYARPDLFHLEVKTAALEPAHFR